MYPPGIRLYYTHPANEGSFAVPRRVVSSVALALALHLLGIAAPATSDAQTRGQPPPAPPPQTVPVEDPQRAAMEEELRKLQRREAATEDLAEKEILLARIVQLRIDLDLEYLSFQDRHTLVKAQLAKIGSIAAAEEKRKKDNESHKRRAREARDASPRRLDLEAAALKDAGKLVPNDPETLAMIRALGEEQTRRLYRTIAIVIMIAVALIALIVPLVKSLRKGAKVRELEMLEGPDPGEVFRLQKEKTSLGAVASEADVVITDPFRKISRKHCEIARSGGRYFLTDCSMNGTTINGKPAPKGEPVLLKRGDRIGLADDVVLRFK